MDRLRRLLLTIFITCAATALPAWGADLRVPGTYATISAALLSASAGDRVLVTAGTYREHGLVLRDGVVLAGAGPSPDAVIIDGQDAGRILTCENTTRAAEVRNLTFTRGRAVGATLREGSGGAILCNHAALTIADCHVRGNSAEQNGGAVWILEASPTITGCVFSGNTAGGGGGGVDCTLNASPSLQNCRFENNQADWGAGLSCRDISSPVVMSTMFIANTTVGTRGYGGGAFADLDSKPAFLSCTFTANQARYGGAVANFAGADATLVRCTLVGNHGTWRGAGVYTNNASTTIGASIIAFHDGPGVFSGGTYGPQLNQCDLYGNTGGNWTGAAAPAGIGAANLARNPLFCVASDPATLTFALQDGSPCHPDSNGGLTLGAWPAGCGAPLPSTLQLAANWAGNQARLAWNLPDGLGVVPAFRLTGALAATPEVSWEIPFTDQGGGQFVADDPGAALQGEGPFTWCLYAQFAGGDWTLMAQVTMDLPRDVPGVTHVMAAPNPFNPATSIRFQLATSQRVRVTVYDMVGRLVARLADQVFTAGENAVTWDGQADDGRDLPSATYLVLVDSPGREVSTKVTLFK
jgi:hypothetical protein